MFYPSHQIRTYCTYLGSLQISKNKYDMGVFITPDNSVSHAIVYGPDDSEYLSGTFIFMGRLLHERFRFHSLLYRLNEELYLEYLENPDTFPQP